ncbi:MAG: 50S ribosomal protein L6 [Rhodothermaceae bacterium]|nr:50S ribosomal protein L6 [Rhodothermaceae bacterium]
MSRIGLMPIPLPDGVTIDVSKSNHVSVKGPKGELGLQVDPDITMEQQDGDLVVSRPTEQKRHKAMHGLYRSLINNMVEGVTEGYKKELEVIGVGYRAEVNNGILELALGFSHPIYFLPPEGIEITAQSARGQNARVTIEGIDKQLVGQVAAKIRGLRPPEPYKGKGIRYTDEYVRRKAGKTAAR